MSNFKFEIRFLHSPPFQTPRINFFPSPHLRSSVFICGCNPAVYPSREARDAALKSGMDRGVEASYNRLATLLAESTAPQRTRAGV
jgi:hypothetical protein